MNSLLKGALSILIRTCEYIHILDVNEGVVTVAKELASRPNTHEPLSVRINYGHKKPYQVAPNVREFTIRQPQDQRDGYLFSVL
jgi:hypothetical protein